LLYLHDRTPPQPQQRDRDEEQRRENCQDRERSSSEEGEAGQVDRPAEHEQPTVAPPVPGDDYWHDLARVPAAQELPDGRPAGDDLFYL
jgi:hypothetical protein